MSKYVEMLEFFVENGISLNTDQIKALKEWSIFKKKKEKNSENSNSKDTFGIKENINRAYEYWSGEATTATWLGAGLKTLYCLGISDKDIPKHFSKNNLKLYTYELSKALFTDVMDYKDQSIEDIKLPAGMSFNDKCLEVYTSNENMGLYNYKIKKYINIDNDNKVTIVNDLYKEYLYLEDFDEETKQLYIDTAKELGLNFRV